MTAAERIPAAWAKWPDAWRRALACARRALDADRLARETAPPWLYGYAEFNACRGRVLAELDRQAGDPHDPRPAGGAR